MTTNEIAYWNLQEQKRTNKANEFIKGETLGETVRHNEKTESQKDVENVLKGADITIDGLIDAAKLRQNNKSNAIGTIASLVKLLF